MGDFAELGGDFVDLFRENDGGGKLPNGKSRIENP